jgi:GNAT superfamily N-acetyltransferase
MIEIANKNDIPRLREIWKACFGDPDSYLDFYFANGFPLFKTVVDRTEDEITSMLTVVPAFYHKDGQCFDAAYLYAVGTAPEWRGMGIASRLLAETHELLRKDGIKVATLFPAEDSLYRFYEKLGYRGGFSVHEVRLKRKDCPPVACMVEDCEKDLFLEKSADFLRLRPVAMKFAAKSLGYFYEEVFATQGKVLWISSDALQGYAVCYKIKETLVLKETSLNGEQLKACGSALMDRFEVDEIFARIPSDSEEGAVRHGMLCVLDPEWERLWPDSSWGYMNLILD